MDLQKMIAELRTERDRLDQAILALERLVAGKQKRRGRPPKLLQEKLSEYMIEPSDQEPDSEPSSSPRSTST
jgi:hypothetical protein